MDNFGFELLDYLDSDWSQNINQRSSLKSKSSPEESLPYFNETH